MINWFKNNKVSASWGLLAMLAILTVAAISGCQLSDLIKFDPPAAVSEALNDDRKAIPLSDSAEVWGQWNDWVVVNTNRLEDSIGEAQYRHGMISSMADMGVQALNDIAPGFPGGALLVGGLSMMSGLFLKKPGADKVVAGEKEDSYNAGLEEGKKLAIQLYEAAKDVTA
jgi:hypothetical protein